MKQTFRHGIHPDAAKIATKDLSIEKFYPQGIITIMMQQHIGAPCQPLVKVGETVLVGQKIGDSDAFVSAPVHSTVSGKVKKITKQRHPSGNLVQAILIENDYQYDEITMNGHHPDDLTADEIRQLVREAGIVGMGGAGFPTHIKLNPPKDSQIDYILINGAECEPYLTSDHRIMLEEPEKVVKGLDIILKLFPKAEGVIGIEDNKPEAIAIMVEAARDYDRIRICPMKTKYPQGAEKQLIYSATRRKVPSGKLPADAGCIVQNIDTAVGICNAVYEGRPLLRRIVTVSGDFVEEPRNFSVPLGTSYRELIEAAGGHPEEALKIISGGPMMGLAMFDYDVPIIKTSSSILLLSEAVADLAEEGPCIRCAKCVNGCPMMLLPLDLDRFARHGDDEKFETYHGLDCIECGACSYSCPAKRHLVHSIRVRKRYIMNKKRR